MDLKADQLPIAVVHRQQPLEFFLFFAEGLVGFLRLSISWFSSAVHLDELFG